MTAETPTPLDSCLDALATSDPAAARLIDYARTEVAMLRQDAALLRRVYALGANHVIERDAIDIWTIWQQEIVADGRSKSVIALVCVGSGATLKDALNDVEERQTASQELPAVTP